jgi:hypothetical protein
LFETPFPSDLPVLRGQERAPHPFILVPPVLCGGFENIEQHTAVAAGDELQFGLTLMGPAIEYLPYVVFALSEMARRGLSVGRAPFELSSVAAIEDDGSATQIYSGEPPRLKQHSAGRTLEALVANRLAQLPTRGRIALRFLTPTRIRIAGGRQTEVSFDLLASPQPAPPSFHARDRSWGPSSRTGLSRND